MFLLIFNITLAQQTHKNPDSIKVPANTEKEKLESIINSNADEIRNVFSKKQTYLIHNASVSYEDMTITADYIVMDWESGNIFARGKTDSSGKITEYVTFIQDGKEYKYMEASFNMNTKQGTTYNIKTEEDDLVINAQKAKRMNEEEYYMRNGTVTTDEYYRTEKDSLPDYHFSIGKMKVITRKNGDKAIVAGPTQMYIEQVPTPFVLPFFYLPSTGKKRAAGILIGSFGERQSKGFYLERWGFYVPFGEYADLETRFGVYTKGSWMMDNKIRYVNRYKYSGNLNLIYEKNINSTKGLSDYSETENYRIQWNHSQNVKSSPNLSFNSSVDYVSQNYYTNSIYNHNALNGNVNNSQTSSSISLVKRFYNNPLTVSLNASASQNISTGDVIMNLPNLTVSMPQVYLFAPKNGTKKGLFQNIYTDYRMNLQNRLNTTTDDVFTSKMFDNSKNGLRQEINLGTTSTIFNYFQFGISGNYKEAWTTTTIRKEYNPIENKVETINKDGFKSFRTFGGSASLTTTLYGTAHFNPNGAIKAIRHMISPSISYNYMPDFSRNSWGYFGNYEDAYGNNIPYSFFDDGVLGGISRGETSSVGLSLSNNVEMKVRDKNATNGTRKIKIFESLNLNTAYNIAADSLKWSDINITGSSSLLESKLRLNYGMRVNPYKIVYDSPEATTGYNVDQFGHFSIANYYIGVNLSLDPSMFGEKKDYASIYKRQGQIRYEKYHFDDEGYARFEIPWKLDAALYYSSTQNFSRKVTNSTSLNLTGEISPAPYWYISASTNYDFESKEFGYTRLNFRRDLRSFNINFGWVPISNSFQKTWDFYIGLKSPIFSDAIKYEAKNFNDQGSNF